MKQPSNMPPQKTFAKAPTIHGIERSTFNRSHTVKSTFNRGLLVPFLADEVLPGDSIDLKANIFARLSSTLEFPIMDNLHIDTFYFYCPNRTLWDNWGKFLGERINPLDSIDFVIPQVTSAGGEATESLSDHLGLPINLPFSVNSLHHRAYVKIYNYWFRSEDVQQSIAEFTGDGPETAAQYPILTRLKRHDRFTSALPFPQKTATGESIPLTGFAPVHGDGKSLGFTDDQGAFTEFGAKVDGSLGAILMTSSAFNISLPANPANTNYPSDGYALGITENGDKSGLHADLSGVQAININALRLLVATQQFLELNARGGTRIKELIQSHFGVTVPDYRLQEPEYLGGDTKMMNVNPVTQTSESNTTKQGEQTAFVTASSRTGFTKSFNEHGVIIGLVNIRADLTYQQGIPKMFSRTERLDFFFPLFNDIGEQAILNQEIFYQNIAADLLVFGYAEAWSEYRFKQSEIHGRFRSDATDSLDAWHLSEDFSTLPILGTTFLSDTIPSLPRVQTVTGATIPDIIFDSYIELKHTRPMGTFSVPGLDRL